MPPRCPISRAFSAREVGKLLEPLSIALSQSQPCRNMNACPGPLLPPHLQRLPARRQQPSHVLARNSRRKILTPRPPNSASTTCRSAKRRTIAARMTLPGIPQLDYHGQHRPAIQPHRHRAIWPGKLQPLAPARTIPIAAGISSDRRTGWSRISSRMRKDSPSGTITSTGNTATR